MHWKISIKGEGASYSIKTDNFTDGLYYALQVWPDAFDPVMIAAELLCRASIEPEASGVPREYLHQFDKLVKEAKVLDDMYANGLTEQQDA